MESPVHRYRSTSPPFIIVSSSGNLPLPLTILLFQEISNMKLRFLTHLVLAATLAISAFAADVTGKWKTSFTTRNGDKRESIIELKADGNKLTGKMESQRGSVDITDGKVDGDNISFSVIRNFNGNEMKINYRGTVSGNEMKLTMEVNGNERETTATRVQ
jgi:opacity protein-like surface antigen